MQVEQWPADAGDVSLIPGSGKAIGVGNGNPVQYSCLEIFMDRGAWRDTVHGVATRQIKLSTHIFHPKEHAC